MTPKKPRKSLDDSLATDFVFGNQSSADQRSENAKPAESKAESADVESPVETPSPDATPKKSRIMDQLMMEVSEKEPTVRFTVDMAESMHRKLSILAARTGKKKVEIVRMLLDEALENIEL